MKLVVGIQHLGREPIHVMARIGDGLEDTLHDGGAAVMSLNPCRHVDHISPYASATSGASRAQSIVTGALTKG